MAVITLPSNLAIAKAGVRWGQRRYDITTMSDATGVAQTRLGGPPRWTLRLQASGAPDDAAAAVWRQLLLQLRGRVNHLLAWNPAQTVPRGTMRGTMTLNGSHAAGATSVNIIVSGTGQVGTTLLSGSPLQLGTGLGTSQLVHTVGDATAVNTAGNSTITVVVEPPLRIAFSGGAAVAWDKASAYFKCTNDSVDWQHFNGSGITQGFALDLLEAWS